MLVQFTVENVLSFRDKTIFSLRALEGAPPSRAYVEQHGFRLLRCAAIYGANASGKSNFVQGLMLCRRLILHGTRSNKKLSIQQFRLDPSSTDAPSQFEFELLFSGTLYSYGFRFNSDTILEEWLFRTPSEGSEELLFERRFDEKTPEKTVFEFGSALSDDASRRQFLGFVGEGTRRNQLFLSEATERNVAELEFLLDWFREGLRIIGPDTRHPFLVRRVAEETGFRKFLESYLASADTGIAGLATTKSEAKVHLPPDLAADLQEKFEQGLLDSGEHMLMKEEGKWVSHVLRTRHRDSSGNDVEFSLEDESDGTRRLMHLAPALHTLQQGPSRTLVVDELDRSLHPLLTRKFVRDFLDRKDQRQEQFIFTTHDTNLLSRDLLPAEAVWFVEKDSTGCSRLYSLAEFEPSQLEKLGDTLEAGYLSGRFGAIPFFADRKRLNWDGGES
jgi:uncharacterized protein